MIDWDEEEFNDLDILVKPIEVRTKEWIDGKNAQLKLQGVILTYGELEDEPESKTNNGKIATPSGEISKSPPTTKTRKRKETIKGQPKHIVYSRKASEGEPLKKPKKSYNFIEILTIQEDLLHEGEEQEVE